MRIVKSMINSLNVFSQFKISKTDIEDYIEPVKGTGISEVP
jgi:hypothetical protein